MPPPPRPREKSSGRRGPDPKDAPRHAGRTKPGLAARGAALDLLRLIRNGRSLDDALSACRSFSELEGSDRAFARHLATTACRFQGRLDALVEGYMARPLKPEQTELRAILRLTAAQLVLLDTPPHAAASTAVDLSRERRQTAGFSKLVNAVSRRISETGKEKFEELSLRLDTPGWLWRRLERTYGPQRTKAIALAHAEEAPLDITVPDADKRAALAEALEATPIGPHTLRRPASGGRIDALPDFAEGTWWVQDVAATLPARLAGADLTGKSVYDLCAAPGGKTLQLAAAGAQVTAVDISGPRVARLEENLARTGLNAHIVVTDLLDWAPPGPADIVLLDAPCSATGTIRRNPDLLWSKRESEIDLLTSLQDRMINKALSLVKPGGMLIYATCSLLPQEGEERIAAALSRHTDLSVIPAEADELGGLDVVTKDGFIRTTPALLKEQGGMDGFFAARLKKSEI